MIDLPNDPNDFTGVTFLNKIIEMENLCSEHSENRIPQLGKRLPECYEVLGMTLALLDCAACCWWGCAGGDHRVEYLIGRAANSAYACLALMRRGYYDQALSSARGLGEIANLLALFVADSPKLEAWKSMDEAQRRREFTAVKVRLQLEALNAPIAVDEERYRQLSGYSIHADPNSVPQSHDNQARARTAPVYQEAGLFLALNEIALPIAFIAVYTPKLLNFPEETRKVFHSTGRVLIQAFGGVNVKEEGRPWFKLH
jgi:hypothetical protein